MTITKESSDNQLQAAPRLAPTIPETEAISSSGQDAGSNLYAQEGTANPAPETSQPPADESAAHQPLVISDCELPLSFEEGEVVGGSYQIIEPLGKGAMGMVYRAKHVSMPAEYALKILTADRLNELSVLRFQNEAQAIAKLNHPNIVAIYNFGLHQGSLPFYVMDLLEGDDLLYKLDMEGPLPLETALPLFIEACAGLSYAHKKGILHRDIKPANLFVLHKPDIKGARLKIVDFGVVKFAEELKPEIQKLTAMGMVCGTPSYMSPEQATGQRIDPRSDIYSLGCTLFETLTGRVPYRGRNVSETMMMHYAATIPSLASKSDDLTFSEDMESLVAKMIAKAPMDRYQTMEAVARDLQNILSGRPLGTVIQPAASRSAELPGQGRPEEKPKENMPGNRHAHEAEVQDSGAAQRVNQESQGKVQPNKTAQRPVEDTLIEPISIVGGRAKRPAALAAVLAVSVLAFGTWQWFGKEQIKSSPDQAGKTAESPEATGKDKTPTTSTSTASDAPPGARPDSAAVVDTLDSASPHNNDDVRLDVLEAETYDPSAPKIKLTDAKYFSERVSENGREMIEFHFPDPDKDPYLAWIGTSQADSHRTLGTMRFPARTTLYLVPQPIVLRAPGFFQKFRPGEITGLGLFPISATDQLFNEAARLQGLKILLIPNCNELSDAILPAMSKMTELNAANFAGTEFDGNALARMPFWQNLKSLSLARCRKNIKAVLNQLADSRSLETLDLSSTDLQTADYEIIGRLPRLRTLNLSHNKISRADWKALSRLEKIRELGLVYSRFNGDELAEGIAAIPSLRTLTLLKGQVKESELKALRAACPYLRLIQMTSDQVRNLKSGNSDW